MMMRHHWIKILFIQKTETLRVNLYLDQNSKSLSDWVNKYSGNLDDVKGAYK